MLPATSDTTKRDDLGSICPDALDSILADSKLSTDLALLVERVRAGATALGGCRSSSDHRLATPRP